MRNKQKGFSLIELLIVVAIILIIAAIAIPNLLRARMAANEASAVASLRTINTACITYNSTYGQYPTALSNLADVAAGSSPTSTSADLLDPVLSAAAPTKSGYNFVYATTTNVSYTVNGNPVTPNQTGIRFFFTDQSAVVRYNPSVTAAVTDSPL
jgi:type IV pilus assembly protein PilA